MTLYEDSDETDFEECDYCGEPLELESGGSGNPHYPYCSEACAREAALDSMEDRQKGDDDGVEYGHPREVLEDRWRDED